MDMQARIAVVPIVLITLLSSSVSLFAKEPSWEIGPRQLPASTDVSDVYRESLLNTSTPDVAAHKEIRFETDEEWLKWVKERDSQASKAADTLAEALSVRVESDTIAGVNVFHLTPAEIDGDHSNHLFVYIHGGAWVLNGGNAGNIEPILISSRLRMQTLSIDYRMPPKHPAPAATDDVIAVWRELLKEHSPNRMVMGGTSAGGNITLSSVQRFNEDGLPVPAALYVGTPAVEIAMAGDSRFINEGIDRNLVAWEHVPNDAGALYAGEYDIKHPHVSPIYGDFSDFPATYLISGTRDLMLSDTVRAHRALRRAGAEADLHIYEGQSHGDYIGLMSAPESFEHYAELEAFINKYLSKPWEPVQPPPALKDIKIPTSAVQ